MNKNVLTNYNLSSLNDIMNTGTLFNNIYYPYKKTPKIKSETKEENLLLKIQAYDIALMDLNLYLDIYPSDASITNLYHQYMEEKEQLVKEFENKYYPLNKDSAVNNKVWKWLDGRWPWENDK